VTFSLLSGPTGMTVDAASGTVSWSPASSDVGNATVALRVDDGHGGSVEQDYTLSVINPPPDRPPVFTSSPVVDANVNAPYAYQAQATDPDSDPLTFSVASGPEGLTIDPTSGLVQWSPAAAQIGANSVTLQVADGRGGTATQSFTILIGPEQGNHAPVIVSQPETTALTQTPFYYQVQAIDPDNDPLVYSIVSSPSGADLDPKTGELAWTPPQTGDFPFVIQVSDGRGGFDTQSFTIDVSSAVGEIQGNEFNDLNGNGTRDSNEPGLLGWVVYLDQNANGQLDPGERFTTTNSNGNYTFTGLQPGTYFVRTEMKPGWNQTSSGSVGSLILNGDFEDTTFTQLPDGAKQYVGWTEVESDPAGEAGIYLEGTNGLSGFDITSDRFDGPTSAAPDPFFAYQSESDPRLDHFAYVRPSPSAPVTSFGELKSDAFFINGPITMDVWRESAGSDSEVRFQDAQTNEVLGDFSVTTTPQQWSRVTFDTSDFLGRECYIVLHGGTTESGYGWLTLFDNVFGGTPTPQSYVDVAQRVELGEAQIVSDIDFGNTQSTEPQPNHSPSFVTNPPTTATAGQLLRYDARATDPDGDPLAYDLIVKPAGMAVQSTTGTLIWTPTAAQVGTFNVTLRVQDGRGGVDLQAFQVQVVSADTPPVITSTPFAQAYAGLAYEYDVNAQTASGGALAYSLQNAPAGMAVDPSTGVLTWVPTVDELGEQTAVLIVQDSTGNQASQTIDVNVSASAPASTPVITSTPRTTVSLGNLYWYPVQASDPSGTPLTYTLVAAPAGMTVDATGLIQWTPSAGQLGPNPVILEVDNGHGGTASQSFTVNATNLFTPLPPVITSKPPAWASVGTPYAYNLTATDPGRCAVLWSLDTAPVGMSIDPTLGTVRWTPTADEVGSQAVTVRVTDGLAQSTQSFSVAVHGVDVPPLITSEPPTQGAVGSPYSYPVVVQYSGAGALTYALTTAPAGMKIDRYSGLMQWTPTTDQLGPEAVALSVTDPLGGVATQTFTVVVAATPLVLPPTITSQPAFVGTAGALYQYAVRATDPAGLALTYSLTASPAGMTIDPASGLINWTPDAGQAGLSLVTVVATNTGSAAASQTFTVLVSVNHPPVINSTAPSSITAGLTYRYDVQASDPDGDPLTYSLVTGPALMSIDAFGRLTWPTNTADVGTQPVSIAVADNHGASTAQSFDVDVVADTQAPLVALSVTPSPADLGSQATFLVTAVDNVAVQSLTLTVGGVPVALDSSGRATMTMTTAGDLAVVATATDPAGNTGTASSTLTVINPSVTNPPTVSFDTPADGDVITAPTAVIGSVSDSNLLYYTLSVAPVGSDAFTEIARGTSQVSHGTLGTFDPSLLSNDSYILRLYAENSGGLDTTLDRVVSVAGNLKLGDFRLSFTDLTIAVSGIPITVTRTYDSLNANSSEDFGYGWSLEYRDADLRTSVAPTGDEADLIYNPFADGTRVYVTLPGGEREGFTFEAELAPGLKGSFLGIYYPNFVPDAGVTSQLSVPSYDLSVDADGQFYSYEDGIPYNASSPAFGGVYTLSTKDGLAYTIDGNSGKLMTATDANGNTLTFTDAGITSSAGPQVTFDRDPQGRIVAVTDPVGNKVRYQYDASGNLVDVTDRQGNTTQFVYNATQAHYLTQFIDPLGNTGVRTNYDAQGRLTTMTDAAGKTVSLAYDPADSTEVVTDQLGNPTTYVYDDQGNIVTQTDALGGVTTRTYDTANNMLTETDPLGRTTSYTYDAQGNVLTETDPMGGVTRHTYTTIQLHTNLGVPLAPFTQEATTTDPLGNTTTYAYDSQGNMLSETDALGRVTSFTYDSAGDSTSLTEPGGNTTVFAYDGAGHLLSQTDALGHVTSYTYDADGNQTSQTTTLTTPAGVRTLVTSTEYDANGRAVQVTDAEGNVTRTQYDAAGNMTATIDALGRRTQYVYDDRGELTETIYPDGTSTQTEYDAAGHVTAQVDEEGRRTVMNYDALGRLVETDNPDGSSTKTEYDAAGQVTAQVDELGNRTTFTYDAAGQQTSVTDALGNATTSTYDAAGNLVAETDPLGHTTSFVVDALGRQVQTIYADGTSTSVAYDSAGQVASRTDQAGRTTSYEYDALGHLTAVVDALGQRTQYAYDEAGDLVSQTDANGHVATYEYNGLGERTATVLPMGQRSTTAYDAAGEVTSTTDFNGATTTYAYDARGRLTAEDFPDGTSVTFTYTADGQRATATDSRGLTTYSYDSRDRLLSRTDPDGTTISYTYDAAGNRTSVTTPAGMTTYTFDALNRLATVTDPSSGTTSYHYDAASNLTETDFPNGTKEIRQYDTVNRLVYLENDGPSGVISSYAYTLSPTGLQDSVVEDTGRRVDYGYDALDRLTSETITDASAGNRTITYTYDPVGNRLTMNDSAEGLTTSTYDANDRLLTDTLNGVVTQYTYDNNGNTLSEVTSPTDQTVYHWDSQNRLIEADVTTASGTTQTVYQYDVDGIRVSQTTAGQETRYLIDTVQPYAQVLLEYRPSGLIVASYVYGNALISQNRGGVLSYYLVDALGSTRALTNASGIVTDRYVYDVFGRMLSQTGNTVNSYLFGGQQTDSSTGLEYLRARYMNAGTGRFVSRDDTPGVLHDPLSFNGYIYAGADGVNETDPGGHQYDLTGLMTAVSTDDILDEIAFTHVLFGAITIGIELTILGPGFDARYAALEMIADAPTAEFEEAAFNLYTSANQLIAAGTQLIQIAKSLTEFGKAVSGLNSTLQKIGENYGVVAGRGLTSGEWAALSGNLAKLQSYTFDAGSRLTDLTKELQGQNYIDIKNQSSVTTSSLKEVYKLVFKILSKLK